MNQSIKAVLLLLLFSPVLMYLGSAVGDGDVMTSITTIAVSLLAAALYFATRKQPLEIVIIGGLIFGYLVANRGFAQWTPVPPIYPGEVGLAICAVVFILRFALKRQSTLPKNVVGYLLAVFVAYATIRFVWVDYREYGMNAVRDFAMIYYALFFLVAYQLGKDDNAVAFLSKILLVAFTLLFPIALFSNYLDELTFGGFQFFSYKGDLLMVYLSTGALFLYSAKVTRGGLLFKLIGVGEAILVVENENRAGFLALLIGIAYLFFAGQRKMVFHLTAALAAFVAALLIYQAASGEQSQSLVNLEVKVVSVVNPNSDFMRASDMGSVKSGTNEFRLVWWRAVYDETIQQNPVFGLGFGADLAYKFMLEYFPGMAAEDFAARSPHSYMVTTFGRTGIVGALLLAALIGCHRDRVRPFGRLRSAAAARQSGDALLGHGAGDLDCLAVGRGARRSHGRDSVLEFPGHCPGPG